MRCCLAVRDSSRDSDGNSEAQTATRKESARSLSRLLRFFPFALRGRAKRLLVALAAAELLSSGAAAAAPLPIPIPLPLRSQDVDALARETGSIERLAEVLGILDGIRVYPTAGSLAQAVADSTAAMSPAAVTFVAAPYFAADPSAEIVGERVRAPGTTFPEGEEGSARGLGARK